MTGVLDEETRDFIKPYAEKWKNKSLFQVVLQYRASKQHDLFNFAQQVHFFNQKCVHNLQLITNPIDLNNVEIRAQESSWLQEIQPPVLKLPFRLDDVPYFDTTYMCDPLVTTGKTTEEEESWNSPFQWRDNISSQILSSLLTEENLLTKAYVNQINENETESVVTSNTEKLINLAYNRDPTIPIRSLSNEITSAEDVVAEKEETPSRPVTPKKSPIKIIEAKEEIASKPITPKKTSVKIIEAKEEIASKPITPKKTPVKIMEAKEEISSKSVTPEKSPVKIKKAKNIENTLMKTESTNIQPINPIAELKHLVRRPSATEDEPPYNFQGMLRKTNFQRDSLKRAIDNIRSRRASKDTQDESDNTLSVVRAKDRDQNEENIKKNNIDNEKVISTEIAPGIFLKGLVADL